uniref:Colipase n=1 Tax=Bos taurus TaxID=9913 RepID=A0AAA9TKS7_BOVIN
FDPWVGKIPWRRAWQPTPVSLPGESQGHRSLDEGELCLNSAQCTSKCCHREDGLSLARCAPKASENSECSAFTLYGIYYKCPCERGLTCNVDKTIVGSITNTNFGVCLDLGRATE